MYPNQQPPLYTTRQYVYGPQSNYNGPMYNQPRYSQPPLYPYYTNNQQPTTVTYINDRQNYGQSSSSSSSSYVPPNVNRYPSSNTHIRSSSVGSGSGQVEKTNMMSNENPFIDPARPYEQYNTPRTVTSITSAPKSGGPVNKTLNLSDENPFHTTYGRYHYPSQIDPTKRITNQANAIRSTDNKSLNLSDENPFYSTYGRYHYPSQIDPTKRITEIPKAAGPLMPTNEMSDENPFNNSYRPPPPPQLQSTYRDYSNAEPAPLSYRPIQNQRPPPPQAPSPPPPPPPPVRQQPQKPPSNAPLDKTSLNMSPDNPFAATYGQYYYPSSEEIKAQKRATERNTRFVDQPPMNNNNNRPVQPNNQMTEYPEAEKKDVIAGKGNTKFSRFDVNF